MTIERPLMTALRIFVAGSLIGMAGCNGGPKTGHERYVPAPEKAQATIATVLESWQRGEPVGEIKAASAPKVFVVDSFRRDGQTLEHFDILGEVAGDRKSVV